MNRKDTEKHREKVYCIVDEERFEKIKKGIYGFCKLGALALLFALFANILSSCGTDKGNLKFEVCEVKTSGVTYHTSEENKRLKEPVKTEQMYYFVVGEER